jgi:methyl-accepting chemotaxis protein
MAIDLGLSLTLPWELPDTGEPIKGALEGIFSPIGNLLKSGGIGSNLRKAIEPLLASLFEKLKSFLGDLAFVAKELLSQVESIAKGLIDQVLQGFSHLRAEVEKMVGNILVKAEDAVSHITEIVTNNLVKPFFQQVDKLRVNLVQDVKDIIDKLADRAEDVIDKADYLVTATIDTFRNAALKSLEKFPWDMPWDMDACRVELRIQGVPSLQLKTGEFYELLKCRTLKRFDEEEELKNLKVGVLQTLYADLQDQSWHLSCAARGTVSGVSAGLRKEAIEDWIEFGKLHQLWNQFEENMGLLDALNQKVQELDAKIVLFEGKSSQIDALNSAIQTAQNTANDAVSRADNAQNTANTADTMAKTAVGLANTAQSTANTAISKADVAQTLASGIDRRTKKVSGGSIDMGGGFRADFQSDGNIVVYNGTHARWGSGEN